MTSIPMQEMSLNVEHQIGKITEIIKLAYQYDENHYVCMILIPTNIIKNGLSM